MFWLLSFLVHNSAVTLFRAIGSAPGLGMPDSVTRVECIWACIQIDRAHIHCLHSTSQFRQVCVPPGPWHAISWWPMHWAAWCCYCCCCWEALCSPRSTSTPGECDVTLTQGMHLANAAMQHRNAPCTPLNLPSKVWKAVPLQTQVAVLCCWWPI